MRNIVIEGANSGYKWSHMVSSSTVVKQVFFFKIPFMCPEANLSISKDIQEFIAKFYPQLCLKLIFVNNFSLSSFLIYKDRVTCNIVDQHLSIV